MQGDLYSQVVSWLKLLLPLIALALLATMFLFARAPVPEGEIPFATIEDIARDPRIGAPAFSGVTPDGASVTLAAQAVRSQQDQPQIMVIDDLHIEITTPAGEDVVISAQVGRFDTVARRVMLDGLARIEASSGYRIEATGLEADLDAGTLRTLGPLAAQAPFGEFEAGGLNVSEGGARLVFNDGVRLLYLPPNPPPTEGARP